MLMNFRIWPRSPRSAERQLYAPLVSHVRLHLQQRGHQLQPRLPRRSLQTFHSEDRLPRYCQSGLDGDRLANHHQHRAGHGAPFLGPGHDLSPPRRMGARRSRKFCPEGLSRWRASGHHVGVGSLEPAGPQRACGESTVRVTRLDDPESDIAWDSGDVSSDRNFAWTGPLQDLTRYYVFVRLSDSSTWGPWSAAGQAFRIDASSVPLGANLVRVTRPALCSNPPRISPQPTG